MEERGVLGSPEDVKFVLTVPAIWTDRSKQFMRVAAIQVNIITPIFMDFMIYENETII